MVNNEAETTHTRIHDLVSAYSSIEKADSIIKNPKMPMPLDYNEVERVIADMLTESSDVSILDSGNYYGRSWERNRKIPDFRKLPEVTVSVMETQWYPIVNIFHLLTKTLTRTPVSNKIERDFLKLANTDSFKNEAWETVWDSFTENLIKDGFVCSKLDNTYNHSNLLSEDFIGGLFHKQFTDHDIYFIFLRIHTGCDIRGGYSSPKIFEIGDEDALTAFLAGTFEVTAYCECPDHQFIISADGPDYELPSSWIPDEKKDVVVCNECQKTVNFSMNIDY